MGVPLVVRLQLDEARGAFTTLLSARLLHTHLEINKAVEFALRGFDFGREIRNLIIQRLRTTVDAAVTDALRKIQDQLADDISTRLYGPMKQAVVNSFKQDKP
jgi:hypothetical protein